MDTQQMLKNVRRLFEDVYSKGNIKVCDELCDTNLKLNDAAVASHFKPGVAFFKQCESEYFKAFPNKRAKIDDIFAVDDKVVVRWTCTGKHEGELQGISPTHKNFNINGISIYRFGSNGKITEVWQTWDRLNLLEQLGIIQPAHALH